jgi:hypothetical protein
MAKNPILEEIYAAREQLLAEHGGSLAEYLRAVAEREKTSSHPIAKITPRKIIRKQTTPVDLVPEQPPSPSVQR